jgi:hypothetical protein
MPSLCLNRATCIPAQVRYWAILLATLVLQGCSRSGSNIEDRGHSASCGSSSNWSVFAPAGEVFSVELPSEPTFRPQPLNVRGNMVTNWTFVSETGPETAFAVFVWHTPEQLDLAKDGVQSVYDAGVDSALRQIEGKLVYRTNVVISGREGIEARMSGLQDHRAVVTTRIVLDGTKLLQANCVMPREDFCEEHARRFLDSFTLASSNSVLGGANRPDRK